MVQNREIAAEVVMRSIILDKQHLNLESQDFMVD